MIKSETLVTAVVDNCHLTLLSYFQLIPLFSLIFIAPGFHGKPGVILG